MEKVTIFLDQVPAALKRLEEEALAREMAEDYHPRTWMPEEERVEDDEEPLWGVEEEEEPEVITFDEPEILVTSKDTIPVDDAIRLALQYANDLDRAFKQIEEVGAELDRIETDLYDMSNDLRFQAEVLGSEVPTVGSRA